MGDGQAMIHISWKDTNDVNLISTCHGPAAIEAFRHQKGMREQVPVQMPVAFADYNSHMGGVDTHDAAVQCCTPVRKGFKCWRTIFLYLLGCAQANSLVLVNFHL